MANVLIGCVCVFKSYVYLSGTMERKKSYIENTMEKMKAELLSKVFKQLATKVWCIVIRRLLRLCHQMTPSPSVKAQFLLNSSLHSFCWAQTHEKIISEKIRELRTVNLQTVFISIFFPLYSNISVVKFVTNFS